MFVGYKMQRLYFSRETVNFMIATPDYLYDEKLVQKFATVSHPSVMPHRCYGGAL